MAGKVLTATLIESIEPPAAGRIEVADLRSPGLAFRITKAGARSWCFRFRDPENGATTRAGLGTFPAVTLKAARAGAERMRKQVAAGINPTRHKRAAVATAGQRTFKALAERFMTEHAARRKRPSSIAGDRSNLDNHILPRWAARPYASIKRADAIELVESLIAAGKPVAANRCQALVSTVFSFAVDAGLLDAHPFTRMKKRGVETAGDRVLSDPELRAFWTGIAATAGTLQTGLALKLALMTGARRGEVAGINRAELLDLDNPTGAAWLIPGARTKNGRDHLIPLASLARETVLAMLALIDPAEPFLLPTQSTKRRGPMPAETLTRAMANFADRIEGDAAATWKANPPSPHDLRRTLETRLAALGIAKDIRDRCLNHVPGDVGAKHYDRHSYLPEKRAALARWNDALGTILQMPKEGAQIVPLARAR